MIMKRKKATLLRKVKNMKTTKMVTVYADNDYERIIEAKKLILKMMYEQPFCKHTITVPLDNGTIFKMQVCPRSETCHLDI